MGKVAFSQEERNSKGSVMPSPGAGQDAHSSSRALAQRFSQEQRDRRISQKERDRNPFPGSCPEVPERPTVTELLYTPPVRPPQGTQTSPISLQNVVAAIPGVPTPAWWDCGWHRPGRHCCGVSWCGAMSFGPLLCWCVSFVFVYPRMSLLPQPVSVTVT